MIISNENSYSSHNSLFILIQKNDYRLANFILFLPEGSGEVNRGKYGIVGRRLLREVARRGRDGDQPYLDSVLHQFGVGLDAERLHHFVFMRFDRPGRNVEDGGDLFHRAAFGDELQYFALARRQFDDRLVRLAGGVHQEAQHIFGDQRRDIGVAFDHLVNGGDEFFTGRGLEQVAGSACPKSLGRELRLGVHGQEDDLGGNAVPLELARGVETVQQRHGNVRHNHVGLEFLRGVQQRASVADRADKFELVFKQTSQSFRHDGVIISQQYPWFAHAPPLNGICALSSVPAPGRVVNKKLPCSNFTLSSMLTSPSPRHSRACPGSNPTP